MSMLEGRKAYHPLKLDTVYKAVLTNYIEVPNTNKSTDDDSEGYIQFLFTLEDGRTISNNCSFPKGTDILAKQLITQLNMPNGVEQLELFNSCIKEATPLDMWVTHRTLNDQTYTNYTFQQPLAPAPTPTVDAEDTFH